MKKVKLGSQGLEVPLLGLGCMGMTAFHGTDMYGKADEKEAIATIHRSFELGGNFLDTADLYGPFINEQLIKKAVEPNRADYIIATKFGNELEDDGTATWKINGTKQYVKKAAERSLKNLGTDYIDLYYLHRLDKNTPIEETVAAMGELVREGKVRYIGLSEVSADTVRKAHQIHPVTAVQSEYSLFERKVEEYGVLQSLQELGIGFVAYSPLGRGFITGQFRTPEDFPEDDFRRTVPRFQGKQFYKNIELLEAVEAMAAQKQITASQLALAWVLAKGAIAIPGTKRVKYLEENIAAAGVVLDAADLDKLESILPLGIETGNPYNDFGMAMNDY
ncbi:MAG: aldo/keto reductase [Dyadobacter sp.]|uniref:aldo/keto reductase n=1 Tax=Dyadobacter sp. TaxID=1914288 RepID=UPI003266424B